MYFYLIVALYLKFTGTRQYGLACKSGCKRQYLTYFLTGHGGICQNFNVGFSGSPAIKEDKG